MTTFMNMWPNTTVQTHRSYKYDLHTHLIHVQLAIT